MTARIPRSRAIWTLPNFITMLRVVAAVPAILLIIEGAGAEGATLLWTALGLMLFAEATDGVDGFVARATNSVSDVGKLLDPLADSLYRNGIFIALGAIGWAPLWLVCLFASRDAFIANLRLEAERRVGTLAARSSGKLKAIAQSAAQLWIVAAYAFWEGAPPQWAIWGGLALLLLAAAQTVYSLVDYLRSVLGHPKWKEARS